MPPIPALANALAQPGQMPPDALNRPSIQGPMLLEQAQTIVQASRKYGLPVQELLGAVKNPDPGLAAAVRFVMAQGR